MIKTEILRRYSVSQVRALVSTRSTIVYFSLYTELILVFIDSCIDYKLNLPNVTFYKLNGRGFRPLKC